ncbi:hypothetical protein CHS0354_035980 [Potamilus streckersoni]|uniref:Uncharacterized protein n=1 Tax=Potamilus streckersoni TaxID=2493646 RepID=A0AAE0VTR2_9BIVA|nr:hypothetical protein CHS0354_035980 [Potamilus streckersoni]
MALTIIYSLIGKKIFCMKKQASEQICHSPITAKAQTTYLSSSLPFQNGNSNTVSIEEHMNESGETISFSLPVEVNKKEEYLDGGKKENFQVESDAKKRWNKKRHKTVRMAAYQTFRWTVFVNNVANPIIYGFCDRKFMKKSVNFTDLFVESAFLGNDQLYQMLECQEHVLVEMTRFSD